MDETSVIAGVHLLLCTYAVVMVQTHVNCLSNSEKICTETQRKCEIPRTFLQKFDPLDK